MMANCVDGVVSYVGDAFSALFAFVSGMDNAWIFYKGCSVPVQMRYTNSERNAHGEIEWIYYVRDSTWVHASTEIGSKVRHMPWLMCTLNYGDDKYDMSEFVNNQRFHMPCGRITWPTPEQLLAAWSVQTHNWFVGEKGADVMLQVLSMDCAEYAFTLRLTEPGDRTTYWSTFGTAYTPAELTPDDGTSENEAASDEDEEASEESTEEDEPAEEAAEEVAEEAAEEVAEEAAEESTEEAAEESTEEDEPAEEVAEEAAAAEVEAVSSCSESDSEQLPPLETEASAEAEADANPEPATIIAEPRPTLAVLASEAAFAQFTHITEADTLSLIANARTLHNLLNTSSVIDDNNLHTYVIANTTTAAADIDFSAVD